MNIGIIYNKKIPNSMNLAEIFAGKIQESKIISIDNMENDIDIAFVIGGDGSFLKASRYYSFYDIPILGFNLGRIGYLAQANSDEIDEVIKKINSKSYKIEKRLMLKTKEGVALNDIVVKGKNCARTSALDLYINDKLLCSYVADGLIISTPTGTTAYSLSAGGPVISPKLDCLLIIPICPHTLNTRPVVIPSDEKIIIKSHDNEKLNVSFDGQVDIEINNEIF